MAEMNLEKLIEIMKVWNSINGNKKMVALLEGEISINEYLDACDSGAKENLEYLNEELKQAKVDYPKGGPLESYIIKQLKKVKSLQ